MSAGPMHQSLLPYTPERDAYRLLGVSASASTDEITAACRRLARTFHPDRNPSARATAEMQVVNTVRQVMSDPQMRELYDRERQRFRFSAERPVQPAPIPPSSVPRALQPPPSPMERYLRAALIGVRATVSALLPTRCRRCRTVIAGEDAYCAACGTPLLTGG
jgi:curved DNA-binding protein CbpA